MQPFWDRKLRCKKEYRRFRRMGSVGAFLLAACDKTVTPWCLEHLGPSFLFCDVFFLRDRAAKPACEEATADFCAYGSRWRRRTRFLVG